MQALLPPNHPILPSILAELHQALTLDPTYEPALTLLAKIKSLVDGPLPPVLPLWAWTIAADGAVFVLDAANVLFQLDPTDLIPLAHSSPLFPVQGESDAPAYLLADESHLFVSSQAISQTPSITSCGSSHHGEGYSVYDLDTLAEISQVGGSEGFYWVGRPVVSEGAGAHIIDIAQPTAPVEVSAVEDLSGKHLFDVEDMTVAGDRLYLAAGADGLHVFDISSPTHPTEIGSFNSPSCGFADEVVAGDGAIYVSDSCGDLYLFQETR